MNKNTLISILLIVFLITVICGQSNYRIFINEFLASNVSIDADIVDFDDYSDWIELYNDEDFEVDIGGYFLTDELDNPFRWQFPAEAIIPAKSFLRVWADGYDDIPGRTYRRPYYPYNYFTTKYYHLNFKLSRAGEQIGFFDPEGVLVDSLSFDVQLRDVSMGRYPDGTAHWYYFGEPTAGDSNTMQATLTTNFADNPFVDLESGLYQGSQFVNIFSNSDSGKIKYTLDGSKPSSLCDSFETQLNITQNTVLRTRIFENNKLPGSIITRSYFIDEEISLPVISIVAFPNTLWDDLIGIYDNSYKEREIPIHFEYFDPNGTLEFALNAGLRLTGQFSLYYAQKSFTIYARERYGQDEI
ncbi:MAG: lamin tail domain-containing protein, partial [Calditrichia bacterium]|nr:lamin tail domain-containing protein [Calditrichia bacterium]